jgi:predicted DNA-binding transcriptional regulator YafY
VLPRDRQDYLDRLERATAVVAWPAQNIPRLASEALIPLQRALAERRLLALDYQGGKRREVTQRDVEPLGLVYYSDNWHLIAWCRLRRDVRDFRTDRILKLQVRDERFTGHDDFSLKQHLEAQQTADGEYIVAQIAFHPGALERVRREHFWGLVEEKPGPTDTVVTVLAHSLEWLTGWVMSFGSKAEALGPERFRQLVAAEAQKAAARYVQSSPRLPVTVPLNGQFTVSKRARPAVRLAKNS